MSTPKNLLAYPKMFRDLLELKDTQLPVTVALPSVKAAKQLRLLWHGYRSAVARTLEEGGWSNEDNITMQALRAAYENSAGYALRIKEDPFDGTAFVTLERRVGQAMQTALVRAVMNIIPVAPEVTTAAQPLEQVMDDHEAKLRALGFAAPQHTKPELPDSGGGENTA
jgi:hypothetical protein